MLIAYIFLGGGIISYIDSMNRNVLLKFSQFCGITNMTKQRNSFYSYANIPSTLYYYYITSFFPLHGSRISSKCMRNLGLAHYVKFPSVCSNYKFMSPNNICICVTTYFF